MPENEIVRELRMQARIYNHAADVLEGKNVHVMPTTTTQTKTRKISAAGMRNIRLAQQKRWAKAA